MATPPCESVPVIWGCPDLEKLGLTVDPTLACVDRLRKQVSEIRGVAAAPPNGWA
jgi:hypothetical protein